MNTDVEGLEGMRSAKTVAIAVLLCWVSVLCYSCLGAVGAEQLTWDCPECGRTGNTRKYCGGCGHQAPSPTPTPTPTPTKATATPKVAEPTEVIKNPIWYNPDAFLATGNAVTFGRYEQDGNNNNGTEDIEWYVIAVEEGKCLLLSKYGLDAGAYNNVLEDTTWEDCDIRDWLNNDFFCKAFTTEEQMAILNTAVNNRSKQGHPRVFTDGGNDTEDRIFLLSYAEARTYHVPGTVKPTVYAGLRGATGSSSETAGKAWWWLRSPGELQNQALAIDGNRAIVSGEVNQKDACIVPAIWIDLNSWIFKDPTLFSKAISLESLGYDKQSFAKAGNTAVFGKYEQDNDVTNGKEKIEWIVLEAYEDRCLLLSKDCLDKQKYNYEKEEVTWETASVREWLNSDFIEQAFSEEEQELILTVEIDNSKDQGYFFTNGGNNTMDQVFLLSYKEVFKKYFTKKEERIAESTLYASHQVGYSPWMLRSPGDSGKGVLCVSNGKRYSTDVNDAILIRPAIWISYVANTELN